MQSTVLLVKERNGAIVPRTVQPQMILVAGPYRSGTNDDPWLIDANLAVMTEVALRIFRKGHLPVMSEWLAFPLIDHAGSGRIGDHIFNEIFQPIARRIVEKCDACLRIGGPSEGADEMVAIAWNQGKTIYLALEEIPSVTA